MKKNIAPYIYLKVSLFIVSREKLSKPFNELKGNDTEDKEIIQREKKKKIATGTIVREISLHNKVDEVKLLFNVCSYDRSNLIL